MSNTSNKQPVPVYLCQWMRNPTSAAKYLAMQASLMKGLPASFKRAALYVSSRAASICVATWAIWCCIPYNSKISMTAPLNTPSCRIRFTGTRSPGNRIHFGTSPGSQRCVFQTGSSVWCKELCCQSTLVQGQASESHRGTSQRTAPLLSWMEKSII